MYFDEKLYVAFLLYVSKYVQFILTHINDHFTKGLQRLLSVLIFRAIRHISVEK
jgi:hypothetical protein